MPLMDFDVDTEEKLGQNGDGPAAPEVEYQEFDSDDAMLAHILEVDDGDEVLVSVPEWKVKILCRALPGTERARLLKRNINMQTGAVDLEKMYPQLLALGCFNPKTGKQFFKPAAMQQVMDKKNGAIIERLAVKIAKMSGMDKESVEAAQKNS
jgi:hypothetical protein